MAALVPGSIEVAASSMTWIDIATAAAWIILGSWRVRIDHIHRVSCRVTLKVRPHGSVAIAERVKVNAIHVSKGVRFRVNDKYSLTIAAVTGLVVVGVHPPPCRRMDQTW